MFHSNALIRSAFGLIWAAPVARSQSMHILRRPGPMAPREVPTPLIFLSAKKWDKASGEGMAAFASMFSEKGYTTVEVDLAPPERDIKSSAELLDHYEAELKSYVRLAGIPFPPVLIARSVGGSLIAQTFISSNPTSAMILISPPVSNNTPEAAAILPSHLPDFDYEPKFPILVLETPSNEAIQRADNRIVKGGDVDFEVLQDLNGQEAFVHIEQWMDMIGI